METTTIILIVAAGAIIIMIYLRFYKKVDESITPEDKQRKEDVYNSPASEDTINNEKENKEYDMPEEETTMIITEEEIEEVNKEYETPEEEITRVIPEEEIEQNSDEHEKEMMRIYNYFIRNGIKNLTGNDFFNIQENIILESNSDHADLYTDIHQIFQITENSYVAITDLPDEKIQVEDQKEKTLKGILGIIECRNNLGYGCIELSEGKKEEELNTDWYSPVKEIIVGKHFLQVKSNNELASFEPLCHEIEKLHKDYVVYINGNLVYIRIFRPASLVDIKTMMDILTNFQQ